MSFKKNLFSYSRFGLHQDMLEILKNRYTKHNFMKTFKSKVNLSFLAIALSWDLVEHAAKISEFSSMQFCFIVIRLRKRINQHANRYNRNFAWLAVELKVWNICGSSFLHCQFAQACHLIWTGDMGPAKPKLQHQTLHCLLLPVKFGVSKGCKACVCVCVWV